MSKKIVKLCKHVWNKWFRINLYIVYIIDGGNFVVFSVETNRWSLWMWNYPFLLNKSWINDRPGLIESKKYQRSND